jgi:hypothetical protein
VRRTLAVLAHLAALATTGCFDVQTFDPGPYVLDNFDDGDFLPADPIFDPWTCFAFNPDSNKMYRCDHAAGAHGSEYGLFLEFTITDQPNGIQEDGGAGLASFTAKPVDFSHFAEVDFDVSLASGNPALSSDAQLHVELGCSTAPDEDGNVPGDFYVSRGAGYDMDWQSDRLTLNNFAPPAWVNTPIAGGLAGCLSRVDSIRFTVNAEVPDGQMGQGTLRIDNLILR